MVQETASCSPANDFVSRPLLTSVEHKHDKVFHVELFGIMDEIGQIACYLLVALLGHVSLATILKF